MENGAVGPESSETTEQISKSAEDGTAKGHLKEEVEAIMEDVSNGDLLEEFTPVEGNVGEEGLSSQRTEDELGNDAEVRGDPSDSAISAVADESELTISTESLNDNAEELKRLERGTDGEIMDQSTSDVSASEGTTTAEGEEKEPTTSYETLVNEDRESDALLESAQATITVDDKESEEVTQDQPENSELEEPEEEAAISELITETETDGITGEPPDMEPVAGHEEFPTQESITDERDSTVEPTLTPAVGDVDAQPATVDEELSKEDAADAAILAESAELFPVEENEEGLANEFVADEAGSTAGPVEGIPVEGIPVEVEGVELSRVDEELSKGGSMVAEIDSAVESTTATQVGEGEDGGLPPHAENDIASVTDFSEAAPVEEGQVEPSGESAIDEITSTDATDFTIVEDEVVQSGAANEELPEVEAVTDEMDSTIESVETALVEDSEDMSLITADEMVSKEESLADSVTGLADSIPTEDEDIHPALSDKEVSNETMADEIVSMAELDESNPVHTDVETATTDGNHQEEIMADSTTGLAEVAHVDQDKDVEPPAASEEVFRQETGGDEIGELPQADPAENDQDLEPASTHEELSNEDSVADETNYTPDTIEVQGVVENAVTEPVTIESTVVGEDKAMEPPISDEEPFREESVTDHLNSTAEPVDVLPVDEGDGLESVTASEEVSKGDTGEEFPRDNTVEDEIDFTTEPPEVAAVVEDGNLESATVIEETVEDDMEVATELIPAKDSKNVEPAPIKEDISNEESVEDDTEVSAELTPSDEAGNEDSVLVYQEPSTTEFLKPAGVEASIFNEELSSEETPLEDKDLELVTDDPESSEEALYDGQISTLESAGAIPAEDIDGKSATAEITETVDETLGEESGESLAVPADEEVTVVDEAESASDTPEVDGLVENQGVDNRDIEHEGVDEVLSEEIVADDTDSTAEHPESTQSQEYKDLELAMLQQNLLKDALPEAVDSSPGTSAEETEVLEPATVHSDPADEEVCKEEPAADKIVCAGPSLTEDVDVEPQKTDEDVTEETAEGGTAIVENEGLEASAGNEEEIVASEILSTTSTEVTSIEEDKNVEPAVAYEEHSREYSVTDSIPLTTEDVEPDTVNFEGEALEDEVTAFTQTPLVEDDKEVLSSSADGEVFKEVSIEAQVEASKQESVEAEVDSTTKAADVTDAVETGDIEQVPVVDEVSQEESLADEIIDFVEISPVEVYEGSLPAPPEEEFLEEAVACGIDSTMVVAGGTALDGNEEDTSMIDEEISEEMAVAETVDSVTVSSEFIPVEGEDVEPAIADEELPEYGVDDLTDTSTEIVEATAIVETENMELPSGNEEVSKGETFTEITDVLELASVEEDEEMVAVPTNEEVSEEEIIENELDLATEAATPLVEDDKDMGPGATDKDFSEETLAENITKEEGELQSSPIDGEVPELRTAVDEADLITESMEASPFQEGKDMEPGTTSEGVSNEDVLEDEIKESSDVTLVKEEKEVPLSIADEEVTIEGSLVGKLDSPSETPETSPVGKGEDMELATSIKNISKEEILVDDITGSMETTPVDDKEVSSPADGMVFEESLADGPNLKEESADTTLFVSKDVGTATAKGEDLGDVITVPSEPSSLEEDKEVFPASGSEEVSTEETLADELETSTVDEGIFDEGTVELAVGGDEIAEHPEVTVVEEGKELLTAPTGVEIPMEEIIVDEVDSETKYSEPTPVENEVVESATFDRDFPGGSAVVETDEVQPVTTGEDISNEKVLADQLVGEEVSVPNGITCTAGSARDASIEDGKDVEPGVEEGNLIQGTPDETPIIETEETTSNEDKDLEPATAEEKLSKGDTAEEGELVTEDEVVIKQGSMPDVAAHTVFRSAIIRKNVTNVQSIAGELPEETAIAIKDKCLNPTSAEEPSMEDSGLMNSSGNTFVVEGGDVRPVLSSLMKMDNELELERELKVTPEDVKEMSGLNFQEVNSKVLTEASDELDNEGQACNIFSGMEALVDGGLNGEPKENCSADKVVTDVKLMEIIGTVGAFVDKGFTAESLAPEVLNNVIRSQVAQEESNGTEGDNGQNLKHVFYGSLKAASIVPGVEHGLLQSDRGSSDSPRSSKSSSCVDLKEVTGTEEITEKHVVMADWSKELLTSQPSTGLDENSDVRGGQEAQPSNIHLSLQGSIPLTTKHLNALTTGDHNSDLVQSRPQVVHVAAQEFQEEEASVPLSTHSGDLSSSWVSVSPTGRVEAQARSIDSPASFSQNSQLPTPADELTPGGEDWRIVSDHDISQNSVANSSAKLKPQDFESGSSGTKFPFSIVLWCSQSMSALFGGSSR